MAETAFIGPSFDEHIVDTQDIKQIAIDVLKNEADALLQAADRINGDFERCVIEIFKANGRLVVTGVGKSAIVGAKIVATLNSTGTPSLFMHGADAIHGDLGMIQANDIVMCISKSGSTPEIKALVPLLKQQGSRLIALVSNTESFLARQADLVIDATMGAEACPNNLAPTTSTTLHLALGDALAVCLLRLRNFSKEDFGRFHPGGSLGKRLYLRVGDLLSEAVPKVEKNAGMKELIYEISSKRLGATAVMDAGKLTGIITDGDLRRMLEKDQSLSRVTAGDIMTASPKTIDRGAFAIHALQMMQANKISQLIVMENDNVVGMLHLHELLREGIA